MTKGLSVVEKSLTVIYENKDFRFDSSFYTDEPILNPNIQYKKIGECLDVSQYGISIAMNEEAIGYPIYRMNEIHNMLCDFSVDKHADVPIEDAQPFILNDKDVLFNRTNSFEWVGRTGVYRKSTTEDFIFASYLVRFVPKTELISPEYLAAFLSCKFGVQDIKRRARQSINQTNVNPEEVKQIFIPMFSSGLQSRVTDNFDRGYDLLLTSKDLYSQAESLLTSNLGLDDLCLSTESNNIKSFKSSFLSTGRLDAEYYQPKYDELIDKIKRSSYEVLANLVDIQKSIEPGSDAYQESGIPFYRVSNLTKFGLTQPDIHLDKHKYIDIINPEKDTILLTKDGTVGVAYKVTENIGGITSGAVLHLNIKKDKKFAVLPDYLTLVLNSKVVKLQAERDAGGSIIQHWKPSEIEEVVIPLLEMEIQKQISDLIQKSFQLKIESEQLLEDAKSLVEYAIELGEDKAVRDYELGLIKG